MSTIPLKYCTGCGATYPATAEFFHRNKSNKDGLVSRCKQCCRVNKALWYAKNREKAIEYAGQWQHANYERVLANHRQWRKSNRTKVDQYNEAWKRKNRNAHLNYRRRQYDAHAIERREEAKKWRKENPEKVRIQWSVRQSRERSAHGNHSPQDIRILLQQQNDLCGYCGIRLHGRFHVDHFEPLSRGGSNSPENLVLTCAYCNLSKSAKTFDEWALVRGW